MLVKESEEKIGLNTLVICFESQDIYKHQERVESMMDLIIKDFVEMGADRQTLKKNLKMSQSCYPSYRKEWKYPMKLLKSKAPK